MEENNGAKSVVIVGTGHAGFQVSASLRQGKFLGRIVLIGEEAGLPYHRPPLSKEFLTGAMAEDSIRLRPAAFYDKAMIERVEGVRVTGIDRVSRHITTESGVGYAYEHLVLATGARHRALSVPGATLDGVLSLRTRVEAVALKSRLAAAKDIVIVGGGFIGLEFSAVATKAGARVTILEAAPRPLARAVSAAISDALASAHRRWGAHLRTGVSAAAFRGAGGHVTCVETNTGETVAADLVLVGIGARPNTELADAAGLPTENGILVDEHLRTADPAISAIGDCAAYPSIFAGGVTRLESVQNATDQGRAVAARLLGAPAPYAAVPWFWSDQGPLKLQIVGLATDHDRAVTRGDPSGESFSVLCFRDERLIGIESINRPADHMAGRKLLAAGNTITPAEAADEGFPLI
jgi:3-phenylpropionate/trans-cinnamate dioxygenase ferredoxin reductase subunit